MITKTNGQGPNQISTYTTDPTREKPPPGLNKMGQPESTQGPRGSQRKATLDIYNWNKHLIEDTIETYPNWEKQKYSEKINEIAAIHQALHRLHRSKMGGRDCEDQHRAQADTRHHLQRACASATRALRRGQGDARSRGKAGCRYEPN